MISANDREGEDFNVYKDFPRYKPAPCFYMIEKPVSSFYFIENFLSLSLREKYTELVDYVLCYWIFYGSDTTFTT